MLGALRLLLVPSVSSSVVQSLVAIAAPVMPREVIAAFGAAILKVSQVQWALPFITLILLFCLGVSGMRKMTMSERLGAGETPIKRTGCWKLAGQCLLKLKRFGNGIVTISREVNWLLTLQAALVATVALLAFGI